jgi:hypothetical protein
MEDLNNENKLEPIKVEKDWFLQNIVEMVNSTNITSIGFTVLTHGFLVSGDLIGGKEYFREFGTEMSMISTTPQDTIEAFSKIGDNVYSDENRDGDPSYVHFKDAKFFHPNGKPIPDNRGVLWRGRISEISGFSLGKLSVNEQ